MFPKFLRKDLYFFFDVNNYFQKFIWYYFRATRCNQNPYLLNIVSRKKNVLCCICLINVYQFVRHMLLHWLKGVPQHETQLTYNMIESLLCNYADNCMWLVQKLMQNVIQKHDRKNEMKWKKKSECSYRVLTFKSTTSWLKFCVWLVSER